MFFAHHGNRHHNFLFVYFILTVYFSPARAGTALHRHHLVGPHPEGDDSQNVENGESDAEDAVEDVCVGFELVKDQGSHGGVGEGEEGQKVEGEDEMPDHFELIFNVVAF